MLDEVTGGGVCFCGLVVLEDGVEASAAVDQRFITPFYDQTVSNSKLRKLHLRTRLIKLIIGLLNRIQSSP